MNPSKYFFQWHPKQKNQQYGVSRRAQKKFSDQAEFLASFATAPEPKHRKK